jgi:branched-chain amino acid aminotransferase
MKGKNGQYEIVTPKADDMVLHGVTRDSAIGVLRAWGIPVIERDIFLPELIEKLKKKEVKEVFATGTAVTIGSVDSICYRGDTLPLEINQTTGAGELTWKLYNEIFNI